MPKVVGFTEKQKMESAIKTRMEQIRRGLYAYKGVEDLSNVELGQRIGISHVTISRFLKGERVALTSEQWLRIVSFAGLILEKKESFI